MSKYLELLQNRNDNPITLDKKLPNVPRGAPCRMFSQDSATAVDLRICEEVDF